MYIENIFLFESIILSIFILAHSLFVNFFLIVYRILFSYIFMYYIFQVYGRYYALIIFTRIFKIILKNILILVNFLLHNCKLAKRWVMITHNNFRLLFLGNRLTTFSPLNMKIDITHAGASSMIKMDKNCSNQYYYIP